MRQPFAVACVIGMCISIWAFAEDPPAQPTPAPQPTPASAAAQTPSYFNPSISVIGNFLAASGSNRVENMPNASLHESELSLQAIVDPYSRADFFISFTPDGVAVEEGFLTFTALPWDLLVKVGRMKVAFGKINTLHPHVWPWADSPLTLDNLLGGEEGWEGDGLSVARLIPLGDTYSELTLQAFRADAPGLFATEKRGELAYNGHYRVFRDLSDSTNLDLGVSFAQGPNGTSTSAATRLSALDFTLRWKPLLQGTYRSAILRGEIVQSRREQAGSTVSATGWFLSAEYQLARRWWVGARGEAAEHAADAGLRDTGLAATLTFSPSEFSQIRTELRRRRYDGPNSAGPGVYAANEVLVQLQFAIGAHGAHPF